MTNLTIFYDYPGTAKWLKIIKMTNFFHILFYFSYNFMINTLYKFLQEKSVNY